MGGFLLPFAKDAGFPLPKFDFTLPGITNNNTPEYPCNSRYFAPGLADSVQKFLWAGSSFSENSFGSGRLEP